MTCSISNTWSITGVVLLTHSSIPTANSPLLWTMWPTNYYFPFLMMWIFHRFKFLKIRLSWIQNCTKGLVVVTQSSPTDLGLSPSFLLLSTMLPSSDPSYVSWFSVHILIMLWILYFQLLIKIFAGVSLPLAPLFWAVCMYNWIFSRTMSSKGVPATLSLPLCTVPLCRPFYGSTASRIYLSASQSVLQRKNLRSALR